MPKVSIIIPVYNGWEMVHRRLAEIHQYCPDYVNVVIVDDCSLDTDSRGVVGWWQKQGLKGRLRFYRNTVNSGFGRTCNRGAEIAMKHEAEILVFLNTDVEIHGPFIDRVEIGVRFGLVGGQLYDHDTGWNRFSFGLAPYLGGWLLACNQQTWRELGGFDPNIVPYDGEDVEICIKAKYLGFSLIPLNNLSLHHIGGQSIRFSPDREQITRKNLTYIEDKWSKIFGAQNA